MTKTIFAGKHIKYFSQNEEPIFSAMLSTKLSWLLKHFFMGECPRDTGDRNGQYEKENNLCAQRHDEWALANKLYCSKVEPKPSQQLTLSFKIKNPELPGLLFCESCYNTI